MERDELAAWLRLALTPGVGDTAARKLLAAFGLPEAIFAQSRAALSGVVTAAQAAALQEEPPQLAPQLETTLAWIANSEQGSRQRRVLTLADTAYPEALLHTADPPLMLYAQGVDCAEWPPAIAIVGSRNPTPQGKLNAQQFARCFADAGFTVVSGLALGVDGAAHEGALESTSAPHLATIAVVGTGLDRVYPRQHHGLAHRIAERGLLISEYHLGTPPLAENFPRRNRLIAALSRGTLVVEAALRSGSLITARQAVEQGKDVFAIPGSIHSAQSRGCHALLKQGAKLVETAEDVLEEVGRPATAPPKAEPASEAPARVPLEDDDVVRALGFDPVSLDTLVSRTGIAPARLQARMLELELAGQLARLPGGLFQRIAAG
ncbi:MAG: DNA-protecting protein DprA [Haliea sp.]|nr:MAG: DNA-protecting protein DprA [Haliea sp.]